MPPGKSQWSHTPWWAGRAARAPPGTWSSCPWPGGDGALLVLCLASICPVALSRPQTGSYYVAQTDLKLIILLLQPLEGCWDYRCDDTYLVSFEHKVVFIYLFFLMKSSLSNFLLWFVLLVSWLKFFAHLKARKFFLLCFLLEVGGRWC
jgi:hypothetical protein